MKKLKIFQISSYFECCVFILGDSAVPEFYAPDVSERTVRSIFIGPAMKMELRGHIKFRRSRIIQKNEHKLKRA